MKNIIVIILLFSSVNIIASDMWTENPARKQVAGYFVAGLVLMPIFDQFFYTSDRNSNGLYFSPGFDPKMVIEGYFDSRVKLFYHYNRFEPFLAYEYVGSDIKYQGYSLGCDYLIIDRKLSLLAGLETTRIFNKNSDNLHISQSIGINTEIRYLISERLSISYIGNTKTRPEISKNFVYSGYININLKIN